MMFKLFNFDENETENAVTYPLLYLHGVCTNKNVSWLYCTSTGIVRKWPVVNGCFKVYAELTVGLNEIDLTSENCIPLKMFVKHVKSGNPRKVLPVYIVCKNSDGSFISPNENCDNTVAQAVKKIQLNVRLIQTFFAESLYEHAFSRKTFEVQETEIGAVDVVVFRSELDINEAQTMSSDRLYDYFNKEISSKINKQNTKYLCFMSCTRYEVPKEANNFSVSSIMSYVTGHAALGGGKMALFGTGSFHTWAACLEELNLRFSDNTLIDRKTMFDDSYGRGTHWANYSTSLGAAIHELGHCFDLAHTSSGIMARGHDDMNCFYIVTETQDACLSIENPKNKYKGAHWHRASAVVLNYHKWFNLNSSIATDVSQCVTVCHKVHSSELTPVLCFPGRMGPVGNSGPCAQINQTFFDSKIWLKEKGLQLKGIVFFWESFLHGIQFIGKKVERSNGNFLDQGTLDEYEEIYSQIFGTTTSTSSIFNFSMNERITSVTLRTGAWVDGIQISTNQKSSCWMGGTGGNVAHFKIPENCWVDSIFGSAGEYVGSIGLKLNVYEENPTFFTFHTINGIRFIEYRNKMGEIIAHNEYIIDNPPKNLFVKIEDLLLHLSSKSGKKTSDSKVELKTVRGMLMDDSGEILNFCLDAIKNDVQIL